MRFAVLALCLALAASRNTAQPNLTTLTVHSYPADHFAISVPSDWLELSKADLDQMNTKARSPASKAKLQPFKYGFQAPGKAAYPRLVIQVNNAGRWSEDSLATMSGDKAKAEAQLDLKSASPALAGMNVHTGRLSFDPKSRIGWMGVQFTGEGGQRMSGLAGIFPTESGSIQVACSATESEFEQLAPTFTKIITSVKIDEQLQYRERTLLSRVIGSVSGPALTGVFTGIAAVFLIRAWRRRPKAEGTEPKRREPRRSGALWKIPLGLLMIFGQINTMRNALAGDGWLQKTAETSGYWFSWGLMLYLACLLIYSGTRDTMAARGPSVGDELGKVAESRVDAN